MPYRNEPAASRLQAALHAAGDEEATDHEEDRDSKETASDEAGARMETYNGYDCDGAQPIDGANVPPVFSPTGCHLSRHASPPSSLSSRPIHTDHDSPQSENASMAHRYDHEDCGIRR